jgi:hypothetical protein
MLEIFRCGWAVSFAGWRRTECTSEDRKAQQNPADGHFQHAFARPRERHRKSSDKTMNKNQEEKITELLYNPRA